MSLFSKIKSINKTKDIRLPTKGEDGEILIYSPLLGEIVPISKLKDTVFSQEILGRTFAIEPSKGKLFSPVDASVSAIYSTLHAICLTTEGGLQILIHIGEDTVKLNGKYFTAKVQEEERVHAGQLLLEFDIDSIIKEGYTVTTSLIIIEPEMYKFIEQACENKVSPKQVIIKVFEN